jgi:protein kinase A
MPSLGFLKKKKTKDDLSSPVSSPIKSTFGLPSSPIKASHNTQQQQQQKEQAPALSRTTTAASATASQAPSQSQFQQQSQSQPASSNQSTVPSIELTPSQSEKSAEPMQHQQSYPIQQQQAQPQSQFQQQQQSQSYTQSQQPQQSQQNAASIQNLINQPQAQNNNPHDSAYMEKPKATSNPVRETKGKYTLTDFTINRTLGTGSFGRVHLVQSKHNQRFYAVKVLKKQQVVKMKQVEHTNDERRMLQKVKHPFLITLWGTFQDSKNLYMVMDFIEGGELFSLLRKSQVSSFWSTFTDHSITDSMHRDSPTPLLSSTPPKSLSPSTTCTPWTSSTVI